MIWGLSGEWTKKEIIRFNKGLCSECGIKMSKEEIEKTWGCCPPHHIYHFIQPNGEYDSYKKVR